LIIDVWLQTNVSNYRYFLLVGDLLSFFDFNFLYLY